MPDIKILTEAELRSQISLDLSAIECVEQAVGRQNQKEITLCDLTGTGIQDTAIATLAYQQCLKHKAGTTFTT